MEGKDDMWRKESSWDEWRGEGGVGWGWTYVGKTMDTMDPKKEVSSDDIVLWRVD